MDQSITIGAYNNNNNLSQHPNTYSSTPLHSTCGIAPKYSGIVSLIIQIITFVLSIILAFLIFLHVGGYGIWIHHFNSTKNTTAITTTAMIKNASSTTMPTIMFKDENLTIAGFPTPASLIQKDEEKILIKENKTLNDENEIINSLQSSNTTRILAYKKLFHGPFQQILPVELKISRLRIEIIPMIRMCCGIFLILSIAWLITLIGLGISIKVEMLDLICMNSIFLTISTVTTLLMTLLVGTLIFYQTELDWYIILLISITTGGLVLCFIFNVIALCFSVVWYRYIDYINGGKETCNCTSSIAKCIKGRTKQQNRRSSVIANEYSIPEATRHSNLPYIDDPPIQQFSNF